ncbi:MAG: COX15/CtaA family protein [Thiobacillaceae bacterium]|nr:COX15/CtaA family protein [Thiobacillaceae bacterium]
MANARLPPALLWFGVGLAWAVIVLGAYVRLSEAGLGCPDWPGCFGQVSPWHAADEIAAAHAAAPAGPVSPAKAWKEMAHRYAAGLLGLAVLAITMLAWRRLPLRARGLPSLLLALVVVQALLGMWTVTLQLEPAVVAAHLTGGMLTLALLVALAARDASRLAADSRRLRLARLLLALVGVQIALGGWVSAHGAALACPELPTCRGQWWPPADFAAAFALAAPGPMPQEALTAIHLAHRLGAVAVLAAALGFGLSTLGRPHLKPWGLGLAALVLLQAGLGLANVALGLPLPLAVAHTAGAALLLAALTLFNLRLRREAA